MIREELLEEAKKRYLPGMKYWNLNMAGQRSDPGRLPYELLRIPKNVSFTFSRTKGTDGEYTILVTDKDTRACLGWVHANKIWAEIMKEEIVNKYEIY